MSSPAARVRADMDAWHANSGGDYVVIDSRDKSIPTNDVVVAIIDNKATIKRFIDDRANGHLIPLLKWLCLWAIPAIC